MTIKRQCGERASFGNAVPDLLVAYGTMAEVEHTGVGKVLRITNKCGANVLLSLRQLESMIKWAKKEDAKSITSGIKPEEKSTCMQIIITRGNSPAATRAVVSLPKDHEEI